MQSITISVISIISEISIVSTVTTILLCTVILGGCSVHHIYVDREGAIIKLGCSVPIYVGCRFHMFIYIYAHIYIYTVKPF